MTAPMTDADLAEVREQHANPGGRPSEGTIRALRNNAAVRRSHAERHEDGGPDAG